MCLIYLFSSRESAKFLPRVFDVSRITRITFPPAILYISVSNDSAFDFIFGVLCSSPCSPAAYTAIDLTGQCMSKVFATGPKKV